MPQKVWSPKRERQYEHIKEGLVERGRDEDTAEEIAARTVNKERARSGEARQRSRVSTGDISSGRRGGLRSHKGPGGRTKEQLYQEAREMNIRGRSKMNKAELEKAVARRSGRKGT
jgi:plasmid stabilization system protein ParE